MDAEAAKSPIGSNRLLYLPYLMGERTPHLDAAARGVFFGLSASHERKDLIRAVMEGVAYSLRDGLEIIREMGAAPSELVTCGGGGTSSLWRSILADLFSVPVQTITAKEGPALGAALLAGVGAGVYESVLGACSRVIHIQDCTQPQKENTDIYQSYYELYRKLYPAVKGLYGALGELE